MNIPKGYKLVPVALTDEMREAAAGADAWALSEGQDQWRGDAPIWGALLAAAPTPPQPSPAPKLGRGVMSDVKRYLADAKYPGQYSARCDLVSAKDFDRVTAERDALQALLTAADERADVLEGLLREARQHHGVMLMSDPPQDAWKFHRMNERIDAALKPAEGDGDEIGGVSLSDKALSLIDEEIRIKGLPS